VERKGGIAVENKSASEMPIGLTMSLAMHPDAMRNFSLMSDDKQKSVIRYVEDSKTGEEAESRIKTSVQNLENGNSSFC
jgi:uncharacterized protein YdeI (YjbR/CyaY-like superfamily)